MDDESLPKSADESMRLARGPLGKYMTRYPMMFATSALITWHDDESNEVSMNNGTVTMIRLAGRELGITCNHVIEKYYQISSGQSGVGFQVGNQKIDLPGRLIDTSQEFDLAVLDLSGRPTDCNTNPDIACSFFEPREWPPKLPTTENSVEIGGFPGALRKTAGRRTLDWGTFTAAKVRVASVSATRIAIKLEREYWIEHPGFTSGLDFKSLFGMSGGPVTIEWTRPSGFWVIDLVGIIDQYSPEFDIVFARPLTLLREDGSIKKAWETG